MTSTTKSEQDTALDSQAVGGEHDDRLAEAPEHVELLQSLDRMLTIGSYYPRGHEKYREVSQLAFDALQVVVEDEPSVKIEVTDRGLGILDTFVSAERREAKRLHGILHPLHVALLEIDADASIDDLHEALVSLKKHHAGLAGVRDYTEVAIEDLPSSVRTVGRSLYVRIKDAGDGAGGKKYDLEAFDPNTIPEALLVPTPDGQKMEREFLAVVRGIIMTGGPEKLAELARAPVDQASDVLSDWVPDRAIKAIKDICDALAATNSDPMLLGHLIKHAREALELTGEIELVELVFEKLRKEQEKKKSNPLLANRPKPRNKKKSAVYTLTREQLRELIGKVAEEAQPIADLDALTGADCLGVCYQVLATAPTDPVRDGAHELMRDLIVADNYSKTDQSVLVAALRSAFKSRSAELSDSLVTAIGTPMRQARPRRLGSLWMQAWQGLFESEHKERAWPYVVNELLMGLEWSDANERQALYTALTEMPVKERVDLLVKLEELPALQEKILEKDLFEAPAPLLYPVHQILLRSSLSAEHGTRLLKRLSSQEAHPLVSLLLKSMDGYDQAHLKLYQAMLDQGVTEKVTPTLEDAAFRYLKAIITRLDDDELQESWVPRAILWLGRLNAVRAEDTLRGILSEKKWLFVPVWPRAAREAARSGLTILADEKKAKRRR